MNHIFRFHIQFWHHSQQNPWKFLHRTPANSLNIYSYTIWKYINITRRDTLLLFSKKKHILLQIYAIAKHINGYATAWHIDCKTHCLCFQILSFYFCMFTVHIFTLLTLIFWISHTQRSDKNETMLYLVENTSGTFGVGRYDALPT
jgi:hypothetical protein